MLVKIIEKARPVPEVSYQSNMVDTAGTKEKKEAKAILDFENIWPNKSTTTNIVLMFSEMFVHHVYFSRPTIFETLPW